MPRERKATLKPRPRLRYDDPGSVFGGDDSLASAESERQAGSTDMDVSGSGSIGGAFPIRPATTGSTPPRPTVGASETKPISTNDQVEISTVGRMFEAAGSASDVRAERLSQIKAAIEQGVYDTDDKLELALERLLAEIQSGDDRS